MIFSIVIIFILAIIYFKSPLKCLLILFIWFPTLIMFRLGKIPIIPTFTFIIFAMLFVKQNYKLYLLRYPFLFPSIICIISYSLSYWFGVGERHISLLANAFSSFLLPYLLWRMYIPTVSNRNFMQKQLIIYLFILSVYGLVEALTGTNIIAQALYHYGIIENLTDSMRYGLHRAQSLTMWSSVFGSACGLGMVFLLNSAFRGYLKIDKHLYTLFAFLLMGVVTSGSRTVIAMTCIALLSVLPFIRRHIKAFIPLLLTLFLLFIIVGSSILSEVIDSFINHEDAGGSSLEMREMQYEAALWFFQLNPVLGNGLGFIGEAISADEKLLGGESIIFKTLIDRGIVGMVSLIILGVYVLAVLVKRKMYFLCFFVIAFTFAKVMSLLPSLDEAFILLYIIPFIKQQEFDYGHKNHYLSKRV